MKVSRSERSAYEQTRPLVQVKFSLEQWNSHLYNKAHLTHSKVILIYTRAYK
jgi:hypothetical protein